jgi:hypothetical protein
MKYAVETVCVWVCVCVCVWVCVCVCVCGGEGQLVSECPPEAPPIVGESSQTPPLVEEVPFLNTYMSRIEQNSWSWIRSGLEIKNYCAGEDQQQFNRLIVFCSEK